MSKPENKGKLVFMADGQGAENSRSRDQLVTATLQTSEQLLLEEQRYWVFRASVIPTFALEIKKGLSMFCKILIANRGEIARTIRAARELASRRLRWPYC